MAYGCCTDLQATQAGAAGGQIRQPYAIVDFISPVWDYEFGYTSLAQPVY
jgi:hypothetical protein